MNAKREAELAAAALIHENGWQLPETYELFVVMIAAAYASGQRDQLREVIEAA